MTEPEGTDQGAAMGSDSSPLPGGGVPVREWEERLAALDGTAPDGTAPADADAAGAIPDGAIPEGAVEGAEELLSALESALDGL